jgi:S-adenosylmethionine hydrolase
MVWFKNLSGNLMPIISLTTDFGIKDGFTGVLKGVILGICPDAQFADITHSITPQNVLEGALALWRAAAYFPDGTVHIAVVDPGVGTNRRPLAARLGEQYFVGPDNGIFTPIHEDAVSNRLPVEFFHLTNTDFWLKNVSHTFHGRDIFAPVAAHIANGVSLPALGVPITDPFKLEMPRPERTSQGWKAHIAIIDIFGNLTTDLRFDQLENRSDVLFRLLDREVFGLVGAYGWRKPGELVALVDSEGFIEIALVNGSAMESLGAQVGNEVEVIYKRKKTI